MSRVDLIVREIMNGMWFVLSLCLLVAFVTRVAYAVRSPGWYRDPGTQAAIALTVYFGGSTIRSGWIWVMLNCVNEARDCSAIRETYELLITASGLAIVGALCCIRVFTPSRWNPWTWIAAGLFAIALPAVVYLI